LVAQDKATMEMEAMEDGFVARILKPDGAQNVLVGEARFY
jgi:pyruvate/2-oxoglutarate dehydrogenase complex dihydrolipoamide acyltransferase (E2) component